LSQKTNRHLSLLPNDFPSPRLYCCPNWVVLFENCGPRSRRRGYRLRQAPARESAFARSFGEASREGGRARLIGRQNSTPSRSRTSRRRTSRLLFLKTDKNSASSDTRPRTAIYFQLWICSPQPLDFGKVKALVNMTQCTKKRAHRNVANSHCFRANINYHCMHSQILNRFARESMRRETRANPADAAHPQREREMNKHLPSLGFSVLVLYLCAYTALYHFRHPAANLAYWCYIAGGRKTETLERCAYYGFFPIYFIHQRLLGAGRHTWDRPAPSFPPGFQGGAYYGANR
jgi:hypothetical protein